jgi:hypothetical protein
MRATTIMFVMSLLTAIASAICFDMGVMSHLSYTLLSIAGLLGFLSFIFFVANAT